MPLCNRETLVYDLRNVPGTLAQTIEVPNFFKGVNLIDIRTKYFGNFRRFEVSRVNLSHGSLKLVRVIGSFEKSRVREIGGEIIELE